MNQSIKKNTRTILLSHLKLNEDSYVLEITEDRALELGLSTEDFQRGSN